MLDRQLMRDLTVGQELTRQARLQPPHKLVRFHPAHLQMMAMREHEQQTMVALGRTQEAVETVMATGLLQLTGCDADGPQLCWGVVPTAEPTVAEAWLMASASLMTRAAWPLSRGARRVLPFVADLLHVDRLEILVRRDFSPGAQWAKWLYFKRTGEVIWPMGLSLAYEKWSRTFTEKEEHDGRNL